MQHCHSYKLTDKCLFIFMANVGFKLQMRLYESEQAKSISNICSSLGFPAEQHLDLLMQVVHKLGHKLEIIFIGKTNSSASVSSLIVFIANWNCK